MTKWILCICSSEARMFLSEAPASMVPYSCLISHPVLRALPSDGKCIPTQFIGAVCAAVSRALDQDLHSGIVICGEPEILNEVMSAFDETIKGRILETIPRNLCHASPVYVATCIRGFSADAQVLGV